MPNKFVQGQIWYRADDNNKPFGLETSVQSFSRPVVIVSNDVLNASSTVAVVVPLTTAEKKDMPTHVKLALYNYKSNTALCEQITCCDFANLKSYVGTVTPDELNAIHKAVMCTLGIKENALPQQIDDVKAVLDNYVRLLKVDDIEASVEDFSGKLLTKITNKVNTAKTKASEPMPEFKVKMVNINDFPEKNWFGVTTVPLANNNAVPIELNPKTKKDNSEENITLSNDDITFNPTNAEQEPAKKRGRPAKPPIHFDTKK